MILGMVLIIVRQQLFGDTIARMTKLLKKQSAARAILFALAALLIMHTHILIDVVCTE